MHLKTTFVSYFDNSANFFSTWHVIGLYYSTKHSRFRLFNKRNDEHFIHMVGFHLFESILLHEFI